MPFPQLFLAQKNGGWYDSSPVTLSPNATVLTRTAKKKLIGKHQTHKSDTGSPQVQVALLSQEINLLVKHLQEHPKDESARRGLLGKVSQRRKILNHLRMNDQSMYQEVVQANALKK